MELVKGEVGADAKVAEIEPKVSPMDPRFKTQFFLKPLPMRTIQWTLLTLDIGVFWALSFAVNHYFDFFDWNYSVWLLLFGPVNCLFLYVMELYKLESITQVVNIPGRIFLSGMLIFAFLSALSFIFRDSEYFILSSRYPPFVTYLIFLVYLIIVRSLVGRWVRSRSNMVKWLVVCKPEVAAPIYEEVCHRHQQGNFFFLLPDPALPGEYPYFVLDGWKNMSSWIELPWAGIILNPADIESKSVLASFLKARFKNANVFDITDFFERVWMKIPIFNLRERWFIFSEGFHLLSSSSNLIIKRQFDIIVSFVLFLLTAPIMGLALLLVKWESEGSPIYRQLRTGQGGCEFVIFKIRSMIKNAEVNGAQWAMNRDHRITRVGAFLRKTRIDELPQLWNVLKGDMSFIGPRPERPEFVRNLEREIPYYGIRHLVKPGITGWAQVMYPYGNTVQDAREKLQYDLYYLKNHSFILDIGIFLKTIQVVFWRRGL